MTSPASTSPEKRSPVGLLLLVAGVILAAVAIALNFPGGGDEIVVAPVPEDRVLTEADRLEITNLRNLGVAHLENGNLDDAAAEFSRLAELLPAERLPQQNLAIAAIMQVDPESTGHIDRAKEPARYQQAVEQARLTIDNLLTRFPSDSVPSVLSARLYRLADQTPQAVKLLTTAVDLDPANPAVAFELYEATRGSRDDSLAATGAQALARVWNAAPKNLAVFKERLLLLAREKSAQERSEKKSFDVEADELKSMFQAGLPLLRPFAKKIENFARVNVLDLAEQGAAAVDSGDWNTVLRNASVIGNDITPEVATQNDRKLVRPHHLEFLIRDFSEAFLRDVELPQPPFPDPIDVTLPCRDCPRRAVWRPCRTHRRHNARPSAGHRNHRRHDVRVWTQANGSWSESFSPRPVLVFAACACSTSTATPLTRRFKPIPIQFSTRKQISTRSSLANPGLRSCTTHLMRTPASAASSLSSSRPSSQPCVT